VKCVVRFVGSKTYLCISIARKIYNNIKIYFKCVSVDKIDILVALHVTLRQNVLL
jgi:hypothetical protein